MTFENFLSQLPSFEVLRKHSKRVNAMCGVTLEDLIFVPYWELKNTIPELMKEAKIEEIIFLILEHKKKSLTFMDVKKQDNYKKLMFFFWIEDQYSKIAKLEEQHLMGEPDAKLIRAGIRKLDVLGVFNVIDDIVKRYNVYTHKQIKKMSYGDIFDIQLRTKIENEIEKALIKNQEEESKNRTR